LLLVLLVTFGLAIAFRFYHAGALGAMENTRTGFGIMVAPALAWFLLGLWPHGRITLSASAASAAGGVQRERAPFTFGSFGIRHTRPVKIHAHRPAV